MSKGSIVVFIVDNDFSSIYFTTPDKYSDILDRHNIVPEQVKFTTISLEVLLLILDNQIDYVMRMS